jgi:hypothetical protein
VGYKPGQFVVLHLGRVGGGDAVGDAVLRVSPTQCLDARASRGACRYINHAPVGIANVRFARAAVYRRRVVAGSGGGEHGAGARRADGVLRLGVHLELARLKNARAVSRTLASPAATAPPSAHNEGWGGAHHHDGWRACVGMTRRAFKCP